MAGRRKGTGDVSRRRGGKGGVRGRDEKGDGVALLKHSFPDQEFVFLVTMPAL